MDQPFAPGVNLRKDTKSTNATAKSVKTKLGAWIGEFIGTFFLVLFIKLTAGVGLDISAQYGIGFGLLVLVYQFGYISGGQFNPCVCIGLLCRGSLDDFPNNDYQNIFMYLLAQFSGALLGGFFAMGITDKDECEKVYPNVQQHLDYDQSFEPIQAFGAEFAFTFLLVFVIINVATCQQPNQFYGLSIGWTVFVSIGCIGHISGCALNIAVWFGTIVSASICTNNIDNIDWKYAWVYLIGDILGAVCAGFLYRFLFITRKLRQQVNVYHNTNNIYINACYVYILYTEIAKVIDRRSWYFFFSLYCVISILFSG